jgi:hypothetical protein
LRIERNFIVLTCLYLILFPSRLFILPSHQQFCNSIRKDFTLIYWSVSTRICVRWALFNSLILMKIYYPRNVNSCRQFPNEGAKREGNERRRKIVAFLPASSLHVVNIKGIIVKIWISRRKINTDEKVFWFKGKKNFEYWLRFKGWWETLM